MRCQKSVVNVPQLEFAVNTTVMALLLKAQPTLVWRVQKEVDVEIV